MGESYAKLIIQPIDLIRAFRVDFCLASVIKWLTKWHMEKTSECLTRAKYYIPLCEAEYDSRLCFAVRMYCIANKFMQDNSSHCLLESIIEDILQGKRDSALHRIANVML